MTEIHTNEEDLKNVINEAVEDSVDRAFKKYRRSVFRPYIKLRKIIVWCVVIGLVVGIGVYLHDRNTASEKVAAVENHDLTLDNNGIFGFTVADFEKPVLGEAVRNRLLIVEEQEVYVNSTITETGLFNLGVFNKQQALTIHGTGQYTIDLTQVDKDDLSLNEDTCELTIQIPHAELHKVIFDPSQTEIGDTKKGWFAFGDIKMTTEQQKEFETNAKEKLEEKLSEAQCFEEADRFAKLSAYETYQPIVETVSPVYKVTIEFQ
ncbi:MAG: DUF4230 domain-containing protein [Lachnospiraceae bacterium]|nr:DUF4230 domain-containing protein [Lachnospiraceae bacterium]